MAKKIELAAIDSQNDPFLCGGGNWGGHGKGNRVNEDGRRGMLPRGRSVYILARRQLLGMDPDEAIELTSGEDD